MFHKQRRKSVALINLTVATTGPGAPKVVSKDLVYLQPGDRLLFQTDPPGDTVFVNLGETLVGLVKNAGAGTDASAFDVQAIPGGLGFTVQLIKPGGGGGETDPP